MTDEYNQGVYATLRELDVKPGDVVATGALSVKIAEVSKDFAVDTDDDVWVMNNPIWRIVSRASDTPEPYAPGERQAIAEYPRVSVPPDHAWEPEHDTPKIWRDMTDAEGWRVCSYDDWQNLDLTKFEAKEIPGLDAFAYRVRPAAQRPKREMVVMGICQERDKHWIASSYSYPSPGHTHRITFDLIDGKPDCDSIKMEEL